MQGILSEIMAPMKPPVALFRTKFTLFTFQLMGAGPRFIVSHVAFTQDHESVPTSNCIDANSGAIEELEAQMKIYISTLTPKRATRDIEDSGKVRVGNMSPSFPPVRTPPADAKDPGKVQMGNMSPSFPPVR
jgi:hypothetical protein